jgi:hypothetical protein
MTMQPAPDITEERIGDYRVHPVAAMFPPMEGGLYEQFKGNIEAKGQIDPIIVQDDILLDGRNRLRACLALGIPPRVEEFKPPWIESFNREMEVDEFILARNLTRRQLTQEQRATVVAKVREWRQEQAKMRKLSGKSANGQAGGRGKKNLTTDSSTGLQDEPKTRARDARSTVGQVAAEAEVSHHKAAQAVFVAKHAPEEVDDVIAGKQTLREAEKKARAKVETKTGPHAREPGYLDVKTRLLHKLRRVMQTYPKAQSDLQAAIMAALPAPNDEHEFIRRLFKEFMRRRRAVDAVPRNKLWTPESIITMDLIEVLVWMEAELLNYLDRQKGATR